MKKQVTVIALIVVAIAMVNGCKHMPNYDEFIKQSTSVSSTCDPDSVYFENDIFPLLNSSCGIAGCHDAGTKEDGISVASYADILNSDLVVPSRPDKSEIIEVITESDPDKVMPPPPRTKLSADQVAMIEKWIRQGARNNKCNGGCDSTQFKFAANVQPLIDNNCKGCHSGTFPSGGVSLTNYAEVKTQASNGQLLGTIEHKAGFKQMPQGLPKLPACDIAVIRKWVQAGAPNN